MAYVLISTELRTVFRRLCLINNAAEECMFDPWNSRNHFSSKQNRAGKQRLLGRFTKNTESLKLTHYVITVLPCLIVISPRFNNADWAFERFIYFLWLRLLWPSFTRLILAGPVLWYSPLYSGDVSLTKMKNKNSAIAKWKALLQANLWRKVREKC